MDYRTESIVIKTASNNTEYVELTLVNPNDEWDEPFVVPVWNERQVARYKQLLASPEVMNDVTKIPLEKRTFKYGFWEEFQLPKPMYRLWSKDMVTTRADGTKTEHKAGSIVMDRNGKPVIYTTIMVFTKKILDSNTNELRYANGWSLAERANQMISRQFTTATEGVATPDVVEPAPAAPAAPVAPAAIAQPTPQPAPVPQQVAQPAPQAQAAAAAPLA